MGYLNGIDAPGGRGSFGLGCGEGCACVACRRGGHRLGETYEPDDTEEDPPAALRGGTSAAVSGLGEASGMRRAMRRPTMPTAAMARLAEALRRGGEPLALEQLLRDGVRDESRMTDLLFFARHPERGGRRIARGEAVATQEWLTLRERWVRPRLRGPLPPPRSATTAGPIAPATPTASPVAPAGGTGACPIEDPLPQARHPTGQPCSPGARKCWPASGKALDLVDADLPCTAERSPTAYRAVLRYFNVADARNARYAPTAKTFCNIFAHDATRALRASIPHWVRDEAQRTSKPFGWNELSASATFRWLERAGPAAGWHPIDEALAAALQRLAASHGAGSAITGGAGRLLDSALARLPTPLAEAAERIGSTTHADVRLLGQDGYIAQQFANLGFPTVVCWANPTPGQSGHIALIAPEAPGALGARTRAGVFVPRSTQAGRRCFEEMPAGWVVQPQYRSRRFFIHA